MYFYCYDYLFSLHVYVWLRWQRFFCAFSSVARQMPGQNPQRRGTARTLPNFCAVLCISCCSMYCLFVSFSVLFECICVLNYCHRVATQLQSNISSSSSSIRIQSTGYPQPVFLRVICRNVCSLQRQNHDQGQVFGRQCLASKGKGKLIPLQA